MKPIYLAIILGLFFLLYIVRACDPATQSAAIENATCRTSLDQCKLENSRIESLWKQDAHALMKCWNEKEGVESK